MSRPLGLALLFLLPAIAAAGFTPTPAPELNGVRATVDLPASQHMRNTGGNDRTPRNPLGRPGGGYGLCVFTSIEHAARWQNVPELFGFQTWMTVRPGGGDPRKVDAMVAALCREKGVPVPPYVQHTGGDEAVLELAMKTDRMPCVTYGGNDDFYGGGIYHMVNLAHLDQSAAAIVDNNRPGVWVWMTRREFLQRWRDMNGGWVVVLLNAPPPPHPEPKDHVLMRRVEVLGFGMVVRFPATRSEVLAEFRGWGVDDQAGGGFARRLGEPRAAQAACVCGDSCRCAAGSCPAKCPLVGQTVPEWEYRKTCGPDGCKLVKVPKAAPAKTSAPVGTPPGPDFEWYDLPGVGPGWVERKLIPAKKPEAAPPPKLVGDVENYGIDTSKVHDSPMYSLNGVEVTRPAALAAIGGGALADDSDRWHLTAVGDAAFLAKVKADVAALPAEVRGRLHVQAYAPGHWAVGLYDLPAGVSLRRPSPARTAAHAGTVAAEGYTREKLDALLAPVTGKVPQPMPPATPDGKPNADPAPQPTPDRTGWLAAIAAAVVALVSYLTRRRS